MAFLLFLALAAAPATHRLDPTPQTVVWGYYDSAEKPVLRVNSGDTVIVRTLITSTPDRLEKAGVASADIEPALREIVKTVAKGPGGHILTGPIFVEGVEPGDTLDVHIDKIELAIPYAYNAVGHAARRWQRGRARDDCESNLHRRSEVTRTPRA